MTALDYLLRTNLYLLLFFGCYYLLLRRHTFFTLNRVYLIGAVLLSAVLPFVQLPTETLAVLPTTPIQLPTVTLVQAEVTPTGPDWVAIAWWIYGLVALSLLVRLAWRTSSLLLFIRRHPQFPLSDYTLVQPTDPQTPTFSFFRYMVLNPADTHVEAVREHELVHIRQWHSADVLLFEVIQALLWFNPVVLAYRWTIRQVHEFLADAGASAQHRSDYARYLVSYALGDQPDAIANSFFKPSQLVSRLRMLHQRTTSRWALGKYTLVVPVVLVMLALTAARPEVERLMKPLLTQKPVDVKGQVIGPDNKALPGANVVVRSRTQGTTTDRDGRFLITVEPGTKLVVSFVGFEPREVVAKGGKEFIVKLIEKAQRTGAVMPLPQQERKQTATGQVMADSLTPLPKFGPVGDIIAVQAPETDERGLPSPGVHNALPKAPASPLFERPRAQEIFQLNKVAPQGDPLYIVDGLERAARYLAFVAPNDIVSIDVLKATSARSIFGEKGAKGVVIITTRKALDNEIKSFKSENH